MPRTVRSRGLCNMHHQRLLITGNVGHATSRRQRNHGLCEQQPCERPARTLGYCHMHYRRMWRTGKASGLSQKDAFFGHITHETVDGCWIWDKPSHKGYGQFSGTTAHGWSFTYFMDDIPESIEIDHLCRVRACVNPWHMDPVPQKVNLLRGVGSPAMNARKTHCKRGHEFDVDNTYVNPKGQRTCRRCNRDRDRLKRKAS